jgi:hypothetical protein
MNQDASETLVSFFSEKNLSSIFGSGDFIERIMNRFGQLAEDREVFEAGILKVNILGSTVTA